MTVTHPSELDPLVDEFQHLSEKSRPREALQMLQKIASMVKPIMRQRNWRVGVLTEFYPREANLLGLNVNRGEKICLRLRHAGDDTQFLPFESVLDTMLHELCHIVHGPHHQAFNALWDKLRDEHEALLRKGYTGEGFLGKGNRLGGRRVPVNEIKRQARAAAERRRTHNKGSGQRLGGQGIVRGQNAREIIAAAAEKRLRIERGCGSATDHGAQVAAQEKDKVTTTKADKQDENDAALMQAFIDLIQEEESALFGKDYVPPSQENPAGMRGATTSPPSLRTSMLPTPLDARALREQQMQIERQLQATKKSEEAEANGRDDTNAPKRSAKRPAEPEHEPEAETWTCEICTLINPIQYLMCGACETERPATYAHSALDPSPPPPPSHSRPKPRTTTTTTTTTSARSSPQDHTSLKPRLSSAEALARFDSQATAKAQSRPVGWMCHGCGNWMESQWWTCASCGRMKTSS
ncbi:uncharacterized protein PV06_00705 [Exophiala oligosperma]|uniref:WLM domain-containing protein n=1 Tax=Exophiala oligosperma TaxID=215243 RepID=A0A0D2DYC3_9EURO|nr:uncharacterized protein PV06_00705 [Exophiala oligosperma]KIW48083.1 hypothetical protein PV06_00705 [Exophiala oligosperma]